MRTKLQLFSAFFAVAFLSLTISAQQTNVTTPDVAYVPTKQSIVEAMLDLAQVKADDVVYDLGCGDGRIVISAAKQFGAKGRGIEIDAHLIKLANENARTAGVGAKVKFVQADIFKTNFEKATIVMLYMSPGVNLQLRPILLKQLKPGSRIVSHDFDMGEWKPEQTIKVEGATLYLWTVPTKKPNFNKTKKLN